MDKIELMALVIILDLTHFPAWQDLSLFWKQKYSLPSGVNLVVVCNLTYAIVSVAFNGVKWVGVDVAWIL